MQAISKLVCSGMGMFAIQKKLAETPYPLDANMYAAVSSALRNEVISVTALAWRQSYSFAHKTANNEKPSESACERLKRAVLDLCCRGLVKRGASVSLGPTPIAFLSEVSLVDGMWIDQFAVELAEFAAILFETGLEFKQSGDFHALAPLQPRRRKEIPGEQAEVPSVLEIADAHAKAASRLSMFTGRTKEIDGRPHMHLDDYRAWNGRKGGVELEVTEGVVTASWNAWIEASGDCPELAGIRVSKLNPELGDDDFIYCKDPERRQRRAETASLIETLMLGSKEVSELERELQEYRPEIYGLLTEVRAILIATERITAKYFPGLKILFKSYAVGLNDLNLNATNLVHQFNELADYIEKNLHRIGFGRKLVRPIGKANIKTADLAASERATNLVSILFACAKSEMLSALNESDQAMKTLQPFLRPESTQTEEPRA